MTREREQHIKLLKQAIIWDRIVNKKSIEYLPEIVLVSADPSHDRKEIKKELLQRVNKERMTIKEESIKYNSRVCGFRMHSKIAEVEWQ